MRVRMLTGISSGERTLQYGQVVDVSNEVGAAWIKEQMAEAIAEPVTEPAAVHEPVVAVADLEPSSATKRSRRPRN